MNSTDFDWKFEMNFPFILFDDEEKRGWFPEFNETISIHGFDVPAILIYPKYYIISKDRTQIVYEGTMCDAERKEKCMEVLPDNQPPHEEFVFRAAGWKRGFGAYADQNEVKSHESWEFCRRKGKVGDELLFRMVCGVCEPIQMISSDQYCDGIDIVVAFSGSVIFSGVSSSLFSADDKSIVQSTLMAIMKATEITVSAWELSEDNLLLVSFTGAGTTASMGFTELSSRSVEKYAALAPVTLATSFGDGSFRHNILSSLNLLSDTNLDILRPMSSPVLVNFEVLSSSYEEVSVESAGSNPVDGTVYVGQHEEMSASVSSSSVSSSSNYVVALEFVLMLVGGVAAVVLGEKLLFSGRNNDHEALATSSEHGGLRV